MFILGCQGPTAPCIFGTVPWATGFLFGWWGEMAMEGFILEQESENLRRSPPSPLEKHDPHGRSFAHCIAILTHQRSRGAEVLPDWGWCSWAALDVQHCFLLLNGLGGLGCVDMILSGDQDHNVEDHVIKYMYHHTLFTHWHIQCNCKHTSVYMDKKYTMLNFEPQI